MPHAASEDLEDVTTAKHLSVRNRGSQFAQNFTRATFLRLALARYGYADAGWCLLVYAYGNDRNHCLSIKLIFSENHMGRGKADRSRQQDGRRFEQLFLRYLDAAYNLARWIVQHDQDAQDIVQDAYIRAFKGFHRFRGRNPRAWFLTITRNTAYDWLNRHAAEEKLIPYDEEKHADIILMKEPEQDLVFDERKERLQIALERLPLEFREVIVLYELEGLSYKELAATLGIPIGTVMSRLSRARQRLKEDSAYAT
jgi:RNA polymerase sigma-70 factor (ECF subfamily)